MRMCSTITEDEVRARTIVECVPTVKIETLRLCITPRWFSRSIPRCSQVNKRTWISSALSESDGSLSSDAYNSWYLRRCTFKISYSSWKRRVSLNAKRRNTRSKETCWESIKSWEVRLLKRSRTHTRTARRDRDAGCILCTDTWEIPNARKYYQTAAGSFITATADLITDPRFI